MLLAFKARGLVFPSSPSTVPPTPQERRCKLAEATHWSKGNEWDDLLFLKVILAQEYRNAEPTQHWLLFDMQDNS